MLQNIEPFLNYLKLYAKPNLCDPKSIVKYVSRYLGRPVIALSRIDSYDGDNVTFHYNKHEDYSFVSSWELWFVRDTTLVLYAPIQATYKESQSLKRLAKVINYNRKDLEMELQNENRQQSRTKRREEL